jgi:aminoglycoside 3-N-acetyltransferase
VKAPDLRGKLADARRRLDRARHDVEARVAKALGTFGPAEVVDTLRHLGVVAGDTIMVHVGFEPQHGFTGTPVELAQAFCDAVGPDGTVVMLTMPYQGISSHAYLQQGKPYDVRPTHPVAAWGAQQAEMARLSADPAPFGPDSPFGRLVRLGGKVVLYDVPFKRMTFEHYLEDHVQAVLPVPLYRPAVEVEVVDRDKTRHTVRVQTLTAEVNARRNSKALEKALRSEGLLREARLSLAPVMVADARAMQATVDARVARGWRFHRAWALPR